MCIRDRRSTWLRYGLETSVSTDSWRSDRFAICRCARMKPPSMRRGLSPVGVGSSVFCMAEAWKGSGSLRRDQRVRQLQSEVALGVQQVSGEIESERGGGFHAGNGRDPGDGGQVRGGKHRNGLDPALGSVDRQLLTLLDSGEQLLADLLGNVGDLGRGLGGCCHGELLVCLGGARSLRHLHTINARRLACQANVRSLMFKAPLTGHGERNRAECNNGTMRPELPLGGVAAPQRPPVISGAPSVDGPVVFASGWRARPEAAPAWHKRDL